MGIYKQPTIYKCGNGGNSIDVHESIIEYYDDWEDVSNEFQLRSDVSLYKIQTDGTPVTTNINDLGAMFSKNGGLIYFQKDRRVTKTSQMVADNWNTFIKYVGNKFKTPYSAGTNGSIILNSFVYPNDISRGALLFNITRQNSMSSASYGQIRWTGNLNDDTVNGISCKIIVNNGNCYGINLFQMCFTVIPN